MSKTFEMWNLLPFFFLFLAFVTLDDLFFPSIHRWFKKSDLNVANEYAPSMSIGLLPNTMKY